MAEIESAKKLMTNCPHCGVSMRKDRLEKHIKKVHSSQDQLSQQNALTYQNHFLKTDVSKGVKRAMPLQTSQKHFPPPNTPKKPPQTDPEPWDSGKVYNGAFEALVLNDYKSSRKLCSSILSNPASELKDTERAKHLLHIIENELGSVSNIPDYQIALQSLGKAKLAQLFLPSPQNEGWITKENISTIEESITRDLIDFNNEEAKHMCTQCWDDIRNRRRYQIPKMGYAEILPTPKIEALLNLKSVRFIQEGVSAPQVYVRISFFDSPKILIVIIDGIGDSIYPETAVISENFKAIIELVSLTYYKDLVVPQFIEEPIHRTRERRSINKPPSDDRDINEDRKRPIPRKIIIRACKRITPHFENIRYLPSAA